MRWRALPVRSYRPETHELRAKGVVYAEVRLAPAGWVWLTLNDSIPPAPVPDPVKFLAAAKRSAQDYVRKHLR